MYRNEAAEETQAKPETDQQIIIRLARELSECKRCSDLFELAMNAEEKLRLNAQVRVKTLEDALRAILPDLGRMPSSPYKTSYTIAKQALAAKETTLRGNVNRGCLGCLTDDCKHWDDDSCKEFSGCLLGGNLAAKEPKV